MLSRVFERTSVRLALTWFLVSRMMVLAVALVLKAGHRLPDANSVTRAFTHYDGDHYLRIARVGYFTTLHGRPLFDEAFLPGLPLLIRGLGMALGLTLHPDFATLELAGLTIGWLGALVAGVLLAEAAASHGPRAQSWVCMVLFLAPAGVFLNAVYTEGSFLALSVASWLLARRGRWLWAASLLGLAAAIRVNALFLVPMLCLELYRRHPAPGAWLRRAGCSVLMVLAAPVTFWLYLLERTHQPGYWFTVQHVGYGRARSPLPSTVWRTVGMVRHGLWFVQYQAVLELLAVALFAVAAIRLAWVREWGLAVFVLVSLASLSQGPVFLSVPRNVLDCFPVLLVLSITLSRTPRWLRCGFLLLSATCMVVTASTFLLSHWSG